MPASQPFYISPLQSDLLDLFRWVAAFLVVIGHLRILLFADYFMAGKLGAGGKLFYFITGNFAHSAVMVFFVMSGFLVGGKVLERCVSGTFSWKKYVVDRGSRLYAVYLLALLLGGTLDYVGYHRFNEFGLYDQSFTGRIAVVNQDFHLALSGQIFFTNLGMCQTILGPVFGSNGPLWSLANEFWYYVAGPLVALTLLAATAQRRILALVALAGVVWFLPAKLLFYGLVWLMGALLYFINGRALLPLWLALVGFVICLAIARFQWLGQSFMADLLTGVSFALVINAAAGNSRRLPFNRWNRRGADFSYSVYLCHFPFLVFTVSILFQLGWVGYPGPTSPKLAGVFALVLMLAYGWCFLVSLATERQTPRIRAWLNHLPLLK